MAGGVTALHIVCPGSWDSAEGKHPRRKRGRARALASRAHGFKKAWLAEAAEQLMQAGADAGALLGADGGAIARSVRSLPVKPAHAALLQGLMPSHSAAELGIAGARAAVVRALVRRALPPGALAVWAGGRATWWGVAHGDGDEACAALVEAGADYLEPLQAMGGACALAAQPAAPMLDHLLRTGRPLTSPQALVAAGAAARLRHVEALAALLPRVEAAAPSPTKRSVVSDMLSAAVSVGDVPLAAHLLAGRVAPPRAAVDAAVWAAMAALGLVADHPPPREQAQIAEVLASVPGFSIDQSHIDVKNEGAKRRVAPRPPSRPRRRAPPHARRLAWQLLGAAQRRLAWTRESHGAYPPYFKAAAAAALRAARRPGESGGLAALPQEALVSVLALAAEPLSA
eukprot:scaffold1.g5462.t1